MLKLSCARNSQAGGRPSNEDAIGIRIREHDACFILCDGVGGERGGGVAARLAVQGALQQFEHQSQRQLEKLAQASVAAAHAAILSEQLRNADQARMAATLVGLFIDRVAGFVHWVHVGDSRLYQFRRGTLQQRTRDHSLVAQMAAAGLPADHISPNLLSQALGRGTLSPSHLASAWPMHDGDAYLLCTDGFWQTLSEQDIEAQLRLAGSAEDWVTLLAHRVTQSAQMDNYSAIAVWVGEPELVTLAQTPL